MWIPLFNWSYTDNIGIAMIRSFVEELESCDRKEVEKSICEIYVNQRGRKDEKNHLSK